MNFTYKDLYGIDVDEFSILQLITIIDFKINLLKQNYEKLRQKYNKLSDYTDKEQMLLIQIQKEIEKKQKNRERILNEFYNRNK